MAVIIVFLLDSTLFKFPFQVEEYFQDFDPLRHGSISRSIFRRCLSLMGQPNLTEEQFEVLASYYRDPKIPGNVMWTKFHTDIEVGESLAMQGSRDGAVVRALASHQCGPGSIPELGAICGLSLLLVLVLAPRVFLRVLRFSPLLKNQHFQIPIHFGI